MSSSPESMLSRPDAQGKNALVREDPGPPLKLVIMGGPGCGKGSMSKAIVEKFGVVHVSVGDILRSREGDGSELGQQVVPRRILARTPVLNALFVCGLGISTHGTACIHNLVHPPPRETAHLTLRRLG